MKSDSLKEFLKIEHEMICKILDLFDEGWAHQEIVFVLTTLLAGIINERDPLPRETFEERVRTFHKAVEKSLSISVEGLLNQELGKKSKSLVDELKERIGKIEIVEEK